MPVIKSHRAQVLIRNALGILIVNLAALWLLQYHGMLVEWRKFNMVVGVDVGYGELFVEAFHLGVLRGAAILTAATGILPVLSILLIPRASVIRISIVAWWVIVAAALILFSYMSFFVS